MSEIPEIELIRKALKAGPIPGPWVYIGMGDVVAPTGPNYETDPKHLRDIAAAYLTDNGSGDANAQLIAACNPESMAAVLEYIDAQEAEIGRLQEDANRYRWLRKQKIDGEPGVPVVAMPNGMRSGYYLNEETADFAIDAAMKERP